MNTTLAEQDPGLVIAEREGIVDARYTGIYTPPEFGLRMHRSIEACRRSESFLLLIDLRELADFQPTTGQRYTIGCRAAELGAGLRGVAVVVTEAQLDPDHFVVTVARNRGLRIELFTDRDEALDWLRRAASWRKPACTICAKPTSSGP